MSLATSSSENMSSEKGLLSVSEGIHELETLQFYTPEELREIQEKRQQFEDLINKNVPSDNSSKQMTLEDFSNYIKFESHLLQSINTKQKEKSVIEGNVLIPTMRARVMRLYDFAAAQFVTSDFEKLCLSNFTYFREYKLIEPAFIAMKISLQAQPLNPQIWQMAAEFLSKDYPNIETAVKVIEEGLVIHKDNQSLYIEAFKLRLKTVSDYENTSEINMSQDGNQETEIHKCLERLEQYVMLIFTNVSDKDKDFKDFLIALLEVLQPHAFTEKIQDFLLKKIVESPCTDTVWANLCSHVKKRDVSSALKLLGEWLNYYKDNPVLFTEYLQLELKNVSSYSKDEMGGEMAEQLHNIKKQCCTNIVRYLMPLLNTIKDYNFLINLLEVLAPYDFTDTAQEKIITKLLKSFSHEEMVWHHLALRERQGLHTMSCKELLMKECNPQPDRLVKPRLSYCTEMYEEGLKKVPVSRRSNLWMMYIDCLLEWREENNCLIKSGKLNGTINSARLDAAITSAFERACEQNCLGESHYFIWLQKLTPEEQTIALEKATTSFPYSVKLWKARLKSAIVKNDEMDVKVIFKLGVLSLKEKALPLWLMIISFYFLQIATESLSTRKANEIIRAIYEDGIKQPKEVSDVLKPRYIEWLSSLYLDDINKVRKVYNLIAVVKPYCKELHTVMARIESSQLKYDYDAWESCYKLACKQFGNDDVDVWLDYINFFLIYRRVDDMHLRIEQIYKDAQTNLNPGLLAEFKNQFDKLLASRSRHDDDDDVVEMQFENMSCS